MSPLAKCIATHDIDFMLRRLVLTAKNVGKSKKQFNKFIQELSRNEKRFIKQCAYQTMREAQKYLYDSHAEENLRGLNIRINFGNTKSNNQKFQITKTVSNVLFLICQILWGAH